MNKKRKYYSEEEILGILREYYESGLSQRAFCKQTGLSCNTLLINWLKKYGSVKDSLSLQSGVETEDAMSNRDKSSYKDENAALKKRIKELEKALDFSRLETEAHKLMIERAEEYFGIDIGKKSGAK